MEATELWVNALVPAETQALFEEAEMMREKWEAERKVCKDDAARKAQEEAAAHEAEEVAWMEDEERVVTKYHFRIQDWYDQSNPTISEWPEPPEPPEPPGTVWFQLELTGTTGSVRTHSSELGSPLIDITTLFIPPCSIHSH